MTQNWPGPSSPGDNDQSSTDNGVPVQQFPPRYQQQNYPQGPEVQGYYQQPVYGGPQQPQYQNPMPQQPWGTPQPGPAPAKKNTGLIILLVVLILILLALLLGFGAYYFMFERSGQDSAAASQTTSASSQAQSASQHAPAGRPPRPSLPPAAQPANDSAMNNDPAGNFNNVYVGSSVTSQPFAEAVRDAYARHFLDTHEYDAVLDVGSPVTGRTYRMTCKDNGAFVTCRGGDNAVVYIS